MGNIGVIVACFAAKGNEIAQRRNREPSASANTFYLQDALELR
jgi:hypothetical protein